VTGGKTISGISAVNPVVAFHDIHGRKGEALFFYFVPDSTQDTYFYNNILQFRMPLLTTSGI
jgi:hypothetical protein